MRLNGVGVVVMLAGISGAFSTGCANEAADSTTFDQIGVEGTQVVPAAGGSGSGAAGASSSMSLQACYAAAGQLAGARLVPLGFLDSCRRVLGMFGSTPTSVVPVAEKEVLAQCLSMAAVMNPEWSKQEALAFCTTMVWIGAAAKKMKVVGEVTCGVWHGYCLIQPSDILQKSCMSSWLARCGGQPDWTVP